MQRAPQSGEPIANEDSSQEDVLFCDANMHQFTHGLDGVCAWLDTNGERLLGRDDIC